LSCSKGWSRKRNNALPAETWILAFAEMTMEEEIFCPSSPA